MGLPVFSRTILEHYRHPRNFGDLEDADMRGEANNPLCGDRIRIAARLEDGRIAEVRFRAEACAICTAAASILTEWMRNEPPAAAAAHTEDEIIAALDADIPIERRRCATLPIEAVRAARNPSAHPDNQ